jgi:phage-related protein
VENECKEKLEELNKKIGDVSSTFNTQLNNKIASFGQDLQDVSSELNGKITTLTTSVVEDQ